MHSGNNSGCFYFIEDADGDRKTILLDDDPDIKDKNIDFIKIDTEGYELPILEGSRKTILQYKPLIQIEWNGSSSLHGINENRIFLFFEEIGAKLFAKGDANLFFYFPNETLTIVPKYVFCF
jgi:hypothetical protein